MSKVRFVDLHLHTEMSLKDGMIRIADYDDPKHVKSDLVINAERRGNGIITGTDHGNMYGHAVMASVAKTFGLKHIPACEFYIAPGSRFEKSTPKGQATYRHICGWARNRQGYQNLCVLQKLSYTEGYYYKPRIDRDLVDIYGDGIIWSDACVAGTVSGLITEGNIDGAKAEMMWYADRFKDDFFIEFQNHGIQIEDTANALKVEWANEHGIPIIATTDAHFTNKEDADAHRALLTIQYANWFDNPTFNGFDGDGYWLMSEEELLDRYPEEYLNNTAYLADKVEEGIIKFGEITPPQFKVPEWFIKEDAERGIIG